MKRHYNVTLRDIQSQTPAKKSNLDALKMIKEKSNVAGCDFSKENQLMSRKIPQEKFSEMTRNRPVEPIMLMKHQQPFQAAFKSMSRVLAGTLQFVSPDTGVIACIFSKF